MASTNSPLPLSRLEQITSDACSSALATSTTYIHDSTASWNESIINKILSSLISETSNPSSTSTSETEAKPAQYKFAVTSTIIQHSSPSHSSGATEGAEGSGEVVAEKVGGSAGRRGMHSASGAYWNNERDGMWSYKWEGGEGRGMDVVVSVMWIGV